MFHKKLDMVADVCNPTYSGIEMRRVLVKGQFRQ
jgi:hypothetical protein